MSRTFATRDSEDFAIDRRAVITAHPSRDAAERYLIGSLRAGQRVVVIDAGSFGDGWIVSPVDPRRGRVSTAPFALDECNIEETRDSGGARWRIAPRASVLIAVVRPERLAS